MSRNIIITGASSGIGEALAFDFAKRGYGLGLTARRLNVLKSIQKKIKEQYPNIQIEIQALDVTDYSKVPVVLKKLTNALGSLEILVANAGMSASQATGSGNFEGDRATIETNLIGAMATVEAGVQIMKKSGGGQIVGISSVAGFRGIAGAASYSASKAGLSVYLEAARNDVKEFGIHITTINPGYIDTPINQKRKVRPFVITVEKGAAIIAKQIENRAFEVCAPVFPWIILGTIMKILPGWMWRRIKVR